MFSQSPRRRFSRRGAAGPISIALILVLPICLTATFSRAAGDESESREATWLLAPDEESTASAAAPNSPETTPSDVSDETSANAVSASQTSPTLEAPTVVGVSSSASPTPVPTPFILEPEPLPAHDDGTVWAVTREWNLDEERLFGEWIRNNVDQDFFVRHHIVTDCADVPYSLRFIFARLRGLPQGVHNKNGRVFGSWSKEFAHLRRNRDWVRDDRFRMAMSRAVYEYTLVRCIVEDTYPIDPWPAAGSLRPGTVFCNEQHSGIVYSVNRANFFPIKVAYSTLPPAIRPLILINYEEELTFRDIGQGLVNWNWWRKDPKTGQYEIVPDEQMPGYSLEQYKHPSGLALRLHAAYSVGRKNKQMAMDEMMRNFHSAVDMRMPVVQEGYQVYRGGHGSRDPNSSVYDSFSTPGRDARLKNELQDMDEMVKRNIFDEIELVNRLRNERFHPPGLPEMTFLEFRHAMFGGLVSPEPWDTPARRWGICLGAKLEWMCQAPRGADSLYLGPEGWIYALQGDRPVLRVSPEGKTDDNPPALEESVRDRFRAVERLRRAHRLNEMSPDPLPLADGSAVIVEAGGKVSLVDGAGKALWTKTVNSHLYGSPAASQDAAAQNAGAQNAGQSGTIYLPTEDGLLMALDAKTGATKWNAGLGERLIYAPVVAPSGTIYISGSNSVFSVSSEGKVRWRHSLPDTIYSSPGVGPNEEVYSGCLDARLYTFSRDGNLLWSFPTLTCVLRPPVALPDGRVYALTSSATLYCLQKR